MRMNKAGKIILTAGLVLMLAGCGSTSNGEGLSETAPVTEATEMETQTEGETAPQTQAETASETTADVETEETETEKAVSYDSYLQVLDEILAEYEDDYGETLPYSVYDMDNDGVKELIVKCGTCEADYMWRVYTLDDAGEALYVDEFAGGHSMLYSCGDGGLYNMMAQMGGETIIHVTLADGVISEETVLEKEIGPDEEYETPDGDMLETADIIDDTLVLRAE